MYFWAKFALFLIDNSSTERHALDANNILINTGLPRAFNEYLCVRQGLRGAARATELQCCINLIDVEDILKYKNKHYWLISKNYSYKTKHDRRVMYEQKAAAGRP